MPEIQKNDVLYLKKLWIDVFKDTDESINFLFENIFSNEKIFSVGHGNALSSMLYYFDIYLEYKGEIFKGAYICGIATAPEKRNKGYAAMLIKEALSKIKDGGYDLAFLIPANKSLFGFYKKFGFETFSYINTLDLKDLPNSDIESDTEYLEIKKDDNISKLILKTYGKPLEFDGADFFKTDTNTLTASGRITQKALYDAYRQLGAGGKIISPPSDKYGENIPLSMAIKFNNRKYPENIYINLLLN